MYTLYTTPNEPGEKFDIDKFENMPDTPIFR